MTLAPNETHDTKGPLRSRCVTVIGAGVAGLVAAHELEQLGHRVELLEARQTVGGRLHTHSFSLGRKGPIAELGAMRIPARHCRTMKLIDQLGLSDRVRQFRTLFSDDSNYLATPDGHARVRDASPALVAKFLADSALRERYPDDAVLCASWLAASVNAIAPDRFRRGLGADLNVELLDLLRRIDLAPFIVTRSGIERVDLNRFFANHPNFACGTRLRLFFADVVTETSSALFRLEGGIDQIAVRLSARLRGPIHRGSRVTGLHVVRDGVFIETHRGPNTELIRRDCVLCTVPFSVLRGIRLSGMTADKMAIIRDMRYWAATKIALHCREAFWERDGISGGASFTGGLVRQTYYPPVESDPRLGATLLASYTIGPDADLLAQIPMEQRLAMVRAELCKIHPELSQPSMVCGKVMRAWGDDPLSMGAASVRWGKDSDTAEEERLLAAAPQGGLFFAGEHCSSVPAWIEGAVESGLNAVSQIDAYMQSTGVGAMVCDAGREGGAA
ncbi:NAD(P)/FAD-dependent oxidoreductase [Mycobacteroides chelonae]|nr:NAD(P)/FAD-dependent oxidoreductase [Mycobacteroides chelonae]WED92147.1 NAD(P)/FAD-dependent oxidoreductase [Mycobacteroides chelonae]WED95633.1 NAD(P)/FAD-dependent oxidoreductase [Mycobacteroides chelonae]